MILLKVCSCELRSIDNKSVWFRKWLDVKQAASHYPILESIATEFTCKYVYITGLNRFKRIISYCLFLIAWLKYLIYQNLGVHFVRTVYICNQYNLNSYSNCDNTTSIYNAAVLCIVIVVDFTTRILNPDHFPGIGAVLLLAQRHWYNSLNIRQTNQCHTIQNSTSISTEQDFYLRKSYVEIPRLNRRDKT